MHLFPLSWALGYVEKDIMTTLKICGIPGIILIVLIVTKPTLAMYIKENDKASGVYAENFGVPQGSV